MNLKARYLAGESAESLSRGAGVSSKTILNRLRKMGVEIRSPGGVLTPSQGKEVARLYAKGGSSTSLAEMFGITPKAVLMCCRRYGVRVRKRNEYPSTRKHFFKERFFAKWTPDMAYVLGLVTADGSIQGKGTLRLFQKDTSLLDKVKHVLDASAPYDMSGSKGNPIPTLRLHSRKLIQDLARLGVHPRKSLTIRMPSAIRFVRDYVRGVFDGDGHGGFYKKRNKHVLIIGFTSGSKRFLEDLAAVLPTHIGGPYKGKGKSWSLHTTRIDAAYKLRDWMYAGKSQICLDRKKIKLYQRTTHG